MLQELDLQLFAWLNRTFHFEFLNGFFTFLTYRPYAIVPAVILTVLILKRSGKRGITVIIGMVAALSLADYITSGIIKRIVQRDRPCQVIDQIYFWSRYTKEWVLTDFSVQKSYKSTWSFPSSHAANAMAVAVFLGRWWRPMFYVLIPIALLISYSRIYIGVHYPSDLLVGFIIGALCGYWFWWLHECLWNKWQPEAVTADKDASSEADETPPSEEAASDSIN